MFKGRAPKTVHKGISPKGVIRVWTSSFTSHKDPLQGLPAGFRNGWGTLQMGIFNNCYPVLTLQCGWKVWCVGVGERADNLSLEFISHWESNGQHFMDGWCITMFYGRVKGCLMVRGVSQLRDCYTLTICHSSSFCAHCETTYSSCPWNFTGHVPSSVPQNRVMCTMAWRGPSCVSLSYHQARSEWHRGWKNHQMKGIWCLKFSHGRKLTKHCGEKTLTSIVSNR